MENRTYILLGALCLCWGMILSVGSWQREDYYYFLIAGLVLVLIPIYSRIRFEKDKKGIRFYLVTPPVSDIIRLRAARTELSNRIQNLKNARKEQAALTDEARRDLEEQQRALEKRDGLMRALIAAREAEKEKLLHELQRAGGGSFLKGVGLVTMISGAVYAGYLVWGYVIDPSSIVASLN